MPAKLQGKTSTQSLITSRQSGAFFLFPRAVRRKRRSFHKGQTQLPPSRGLPRRAGASCNSLDAGSPAKASSLAKQDTVLRKSPSNPVIPQAPQSIHPSFPAAQAHTQPRTSYIHAALTDYPFVCAHLVMITYHGVRVSLLLSFIFPFSAYRISTTFCRDQN